jgi:hypothetical protein
MIRIMLNIDELTALVRARAKLAQEGEQECVDALSSILRDSALDVSAAD